MIEILTSFLSSIRQTSPVIFLGLAIASSIILFSGNDFINYIGLKDFKNENQGYIGATFVVSIAIVTAQFIWNFGGFLKTLNERRRKSKLYKLKRKNSEKYLHDLTPDEKGYLEPYILANENTQYFLIEDGISGGLEAKGIIYKSSSIGDMLNGLAYNIQPWAKEYLLKNKYLLEGAKPRDETYPIT